MLVVFGPMAAILGYVAGAPLVGVLAFVGASVAVIAAVMTALALWAGAPEEEVALGGHHAAEPPEGRGLGGGGGWHGGGGDGGGWDGGGGDGGGGGW